MDRNLGAVGNDFAGHGSLEENSTSPGIGAVYYQYGRKDPMPRALGTCAYTDDVQSFIYAVNNPVTFIPNSTGNWNTDTEGESSYLWHDRAVKSNTDGKSIFDPSPIGWKIPARLTYTDFSATTINYDNSINYGGVYTSNSINSYFPLSGYRHPAVSSVVNVGVLSGSWTSTPSSTTAGNFLYISENNIYGGSGTYHRSYGLPVRPIRD